MHGFNRAKTVYYDKNGNMIKNTNGYGINKNSLIKSEIKPGAVVHKRGMKLVDLGWLNSGLTFWFEDDSGRRYPMTDSVFLNYIKENPIEFGDMDIEFLQRGSVYSIGFVKEKKNDC